MSTINFDPKKSLLSEDGLGLYDSERLETTQGNKVQQEETIFDCNTETKSIQTLNAVAIRGFGHTDG